MLILFFLFLLGFPVGMASSLFGIGGGIFIVPALYALFPEFSPQIVIATSLSIIFVGSILSSLVFYRHGPKPSSKMALPTMFAMMVGSFIGTELSFYFAPETLKTLFGGVLLFVALQMLLPKKKMTECPSISPREMLVGGLASLMAGTFGGITGLGGGVIIMPVLNLILSFPMRVASSYSNLAIASGTLVALVRFSLSSPPKIPLHHPVLETLRIGHIFPTIAILLLPGIYLGCRYGIRLLKRLPERNIKILFALLLLFLALKTLFKA